MKLFKSRKSGYYYVSFGRGKEKSHRTKNRILAQKLFEPIQKEYILGNFNIHLPKQQTHTLGEFRNEYELSRKGVKSVNTLRIDGESLDRFIDFLKEKKGEDDLELSKITVKDAEEFVSRLSRQIRPVTVNIRIRHLKAAFRKAVEWGSEWLDKSPFETIKQIPIKNDLPRAMTEGEARMLLASIAEEATQHPRWKEFYEYVGTCLLTGGRRESVAKIEWKDFRLYDGGRWTVAFRVNKDTVDVVPVSIGMQNLLFYRKQESGPVFPYYHKYFRQATKHFRIFADRVGLHNVRLHDTRHTFGTLMIVKGVHQKKVQTMLGHSTPKMTDHYTKLAGIYLQGETDAMDTILLEDKASI